MELGRYAFASLAADPSTSRTITAAQRINQQARRHQQHAAGTVEQSPDGIGQDIVEPLTLAVRPNMAKGRDDAADRDQLEWFGNIGHRVEADEKVAVGGA